MGSRVGICTQANFFQRLMTVILTGFISFSLYHYFNNGYVVRQPVALEESAEHYWPFSKQALVLCVCSTSLLKTLWEKKKLLITSNFSFSHRVFFSFRELFPPLSSNLKLLSANSFSLEESAYCYNRKG